MIINYNKLGSLKGDEVVFTIGCYDLLHVNHIWFLSQTKSLAPGCKLLVGVISDLETKKVKGKDRPVISQLERAKMLDALKMVDYVFLAPDLVPQELSMSVVSTLKPKYLSSTKEKWLSQKSELEDFGTELIYLKEIDGRSTTQIINSIKNER